MPIQALRRKKMNYSTKDIENEEIERAMKQYDEEESEKERKKKEQIENAVAQMVVQWNAEMQGKKEITEEQAEKIAKSITKDVETGKLRITKYGIDINDEFEWW